MPGSSRSRSPTAAATRTRRSGSGPAPRRDAVPGSGRSRSGVRSPGVHRQPAALGLDDAVRDAGSRAAPVHDRRRESRADRGRAAAQPGVARVRIEPLARRGCDARRWRKLSGAASTKRSATATAGVRRPLSRVRMLEKTPKNSLRVPFLARVFPEARFIYLYRDPRQVLSSMIEAWTTRAVSHLSATARLDRPGVVAAARARLARADRAAAA